MKTLLISAAVLLISQFSIGQNIEGRAVYHAQSDLGDQLSSQEKIPPAMQKMIEDMFKKQTQKTFVLEFKNNESVFKETENNQIDDGFGQGNTQAKMIIQTSEGENEIIYKNLSDNTIKNQTTIYGKTFLIDDKITKHNWVLTSETKHIGKYLCNKAYYISKDQNPSSEESKTDTTIAWYTTEIPISNGPKDLGGLPGLILEYKNGLTTIQCSEVILNPKKSIKIKIPKKGKVVTIKQFEKIIDKKDKELRERFGQGNDDGSNFEIIIGQ